MPAPTFSLGVQATRSGLLFLLLGADGKVAHRLKRAYGTDEESAGDAAGWWRSLRTGVKDLLRRATIDAGRIRAVGICDEPGLHVAMRLDGSAAATLVAGVDVAGDNAALAELNAAIGLRSLANLTGRVPRAQGLAVQLVRLRSSDKRAWHDLNLALSAKGWLIHRLTGKPVADAGSAAATLLWNQRSKLWSKQVAGSLAIDPAWLPPVAASSVAAGRVTDAAARETGLTAGIPVAVGPAHAGALHLLAGTDIVVELGGIGAVVANAATAGLEQTALADGGIGFETAGAASEDLPTWMLSVAMPAEAAQARRGQRDPLEALADAAAEVPAGSLGLAVGTTLAGLTVTGIDPRRHTPGHLVRAALEGGALAAARVLPATGTISVAGPGAATPLWGQILADAVGRPVSSLHEPMPAALAVAIIAASLAGMTKAAEECPKKLRASATAHQPRKSASEALAETSARISQLVLPRPAAVVQG